jgi:hypothetical protein
LERADAVPLANIFAMAVGFCIAAFGVLGFASPAVLLEIGKALQATGGLWFLAFVRIVCGGILIWAAPNSRTPRILIGLGILIIVAGLATPFIGVEKTRSMFEWWTSQGSSLARACPLVAVALGGFIAWVVTSPA